MDTSRNATCKKEVNFMPAANEFVDLKFKITREQRALIKEYEGKTWARDHHDFFIDKCLGLLKARPELIEEMRGIPAPKTRRRT